MSNHTRLLFLCVANSARSQMAEGLARAMAPPGDVIQSAGSAPTSVNPFAAAVMREIGVDIAAHRSKPIAAIDLDAVDVVVTLCADEVCPALPARVKRLTWPLPDPARVGGSQGAVLEAFRRTRDEIARRLADHFGWSAPESHVERHIS